MKTKNKILSAALAVALSTAFLYATGPAGCGSAGGGDTGGLSGATLTSDQQKQIIDVMEANNDALSAVTRGLSSAVPSGLVLDEEPSDFTSTFSCNSGNLTFSSGTSGSASFTITANSCLLYEDGTTSNASTNLLLNGGMSFSTNTTTHVSVLSYSPLTMTRGAQNCSLGGNITINQVSSSPYNSNEVFNLNGTCNSVTYTQTGTLTLSQTSDSSPLLLNGTLVFSTGGSGHTCRFTNINVETATCETYAQACGFIGSSVCEE